MKGYRALANNIQPTGMMGFIQKIGEPPDNLETGADSTEVYGSGAFLLAGSEIVRLLDSSKRRTDADGHIRWFSGFGWEGQGEITTAEKWTAYLKGFAAKFVKAPFATPTFEVHTLPVPVETPPPAPKAE
jgi:hypothetical protein